MKFTVSKTEMQKKLSDIQGIVEKRNTMPVLSHFLLNASGNDSYIVATDLETTLKEPLQIEVEKEGKLCIPARKLFEIVKEADEDLSFESAGDQWLEVKSGNSNFKLACLPADEFPAWPEIGEAEDILLEAETLLDMIEKTIYSAGDTDHKYTLNGLLFHLRPDKGRLRLVGTDGHRLAAVSKQIETGVKEERQLIVSKKAVSEVRRLLGMAEKVRISMGKNHALFSVGNVQFLTRLIEGTYPDYERVIPKTNGKKVSIERDAFMKTLNRVSVMSKETSHAVRLDLAENLITLSSSNPNLGKAKDEVAADYKGDELTIAFNARYLLDALKVMASEKVILELEDPLSPTLLIDEKDREWKYVVMPIRI
ncbi:MAG: DNA polymerase III subunit beta [Nitrospirota bacterium]